MKEYVIPVVFATDDRFVLPLSVAITSLLVNASESTCYSVFILLSKQLGEQNQTLLNKIFSKYSRHFLRFILVDGNKLDGVKIGDTTLTIASCYRLLVSKLLPDYDKCIYLDGDIIVQGDLGGVYARNIEHYYISGVQDWGIAYKAKRYGEHELPVGLTEKAGYINSGVLLWNLKKIREDCLEERFIEKLSFAYRRVDQDIINVCCQSKIDYLSCYYNFFPWYDKLIRLFPEKKTELKDIDYEKAVMIHFTSSDGKPWLNRKVKYAQLWWKYAAMSYSENEIAGQMQNACKWELGYNWNSIIRKCGSYERIIIFGFSEIGKGVYLGIKRYYPDRKYYFADNSIQKIGQVFNGLCVTRISELWNPDYKSVVINTSQRYSGEIDIQLRQLGIEMDNICHYMKKSEYYYLSLDSRYHEDELEQIFMKEYGLHWKAELKQQKEKGFHEIMEQKYWLSLWYSK